MAINFSGLGLGLQSASEIKFGAGQEGVQRCHHLCALADRRSDALHRFCAHIADCEDAAARRFQLMAAGAGFAAGEDKAFCVESDPRTAEPVGIWFGANEQEQMFNRAPLLPGRSRCRQRTASSMPSGLQAR